MSKLLATLSDASRSGLYWAPRDTELIDATRGSKLDVTRMDLGGASSRQAVLDIFARTLAFPAWFGGNWDALEDCLSDLSWRTGEGWVILIEGAGGIPEDDIGVLRDILESCAQSWAGRMPFFAVMVGAKNTLALPALFHAEP